MIFVEIQQRWYSVINFWKTDIIYCAVKKLQLYLNVEGVDTTFRIPSI